MLARVTAGSGPQVVLTHGVGDCAYGFASLITELASKYSVIALDHRGHGHSPRFDDRQLADPFAVLVDDLIAELETLRRPVIYGHSMGASVAATAATRRPDLVAGLILEDPPWVDREIAEQRLIGEARVAAVEHECRDLPAALQRQLRAGWAPEEAAAWAAGRPLVQTEFPATGVVRGDWPWRDEVAGLVESGVPTTVLAGTLVEPDKVQGLDVTVIEGADHNVRRSRPVETTAAITKALAQHT